VTENNLLAEMFGFNLTLLKKELENRIIEVKEKWGETC